MSQNIESSVDNNLVARIKAGLEAGLPHLTPAQIGVLQTRFGFGKPLAIVVAEGDAIPDVVHDYECLFEAGQRSESRAEREKTEFRQMLRGMGLPVGEWRSVMRSAKTVRQTSKDRKVRLRRVSKFHHLEGQRKTVKEEMEIVQGNLQAVKGTDWEATIQSELDGLRAELASLEEALAGV